MMKTHFGAIALAICICCIACTDSPPAITIVQLEENVELRLWQDLSPEGSIPQLLLKTTEIYNCPEAEILSEYTVSNNTVELSIESIEIPEDCNTVTLQNITKKHELELEEGDYQMHVHLSDVVTHEGILEFGESQIKLSLNSSTGIKYSNATLNRLPNNSLWGYIDDPVLQNEFISSIDRETDKVFLEGDYAYLTKMPDGTIQINDNQQKEGFLMQYRSNESWSTILAKLNSMHIIDPTNVYLQNYSGEFYRN